MLALIWKLPVCAPTPVLHTRANLPKSSPEAHKEGWIIGGQIWSYYQFGKIFLLYVRYR